MSASAEAEVNDHKVFQDILSEMDNNLNFTKGPAQKKPKPTPQPKLLSAEDECKLNFLKRLQFIAEHTAQRVQVVHQLPC
jgi:hypothetical protein